MGHSAGVISAPVNTDDVSEVLGVASDDVKTLCVSDQINPAALYRPRYMGGMVHVAPENFQSTLKDLVPPSSGVSGITMKCVNYGVWVPYITSTINGYPWDAGRIRWNPRPCDSTQFGDLTHFIGYNHQAKFTNPVTSILCSQGAKIKVTFQDRSASDTISARTLFSDNEDAYFGFFVYEYTGDGPVLSGTGAVTPKLYVNNYSVAQCSSAYAVVSDFDASAGHGYDIIPVIVVDNNDDLEYYGLNISDQVPGFYRKMVGTNDIEFIYFRYSEGTFYPDGDEVETGTDIGVTKPTFGFALQMTSPFSKILADSDTAYSSGLIRPSTIKLTAKFTRASDSQSYTKEFTTSNGLNVLTQLNTNILRMYMDTTSTGNVVYDWASSTAGTLSGYFDFDISFTINVNTSGGSEANSYPAQSWMAG